MWVRHRRHILVLRVIHLIVYLIIKITKFQARCGRPCFNPGTGVAEAGRWISEFEDGLIYRVPGLQRNLILENQTDYRSPFPYSLLSHPKKPWGNWWLSTDRSTQQRPSESLDLQLVDMCPSHGCSWVTSYEPPTNHKETKAPVLGVFCQVQENVFLVEGHLL